MLEKIEKSKKLKIFQIQNVKTDEKIFLKKQDLLLNLS